MDLVIVGCCWLESRVLPTDTPTHHTIRTPLTFRGQAPLSKLEIRPKKKKNQFSAVSPLFSTFSHPFMLVVPGSQASEKDFLGLEVGSEMCFRCGPFCPLRRRGATKDVPHPAPQYWGCRALLPSLRCSLLTCSMLVINAQGPAPFESNYSPYGSLSTK